MKRSLLTIIFSYTLLLPTTIFCMGEELLDREIRQCAEDFFWGYGDVGFDQRKRVEEIKRLCNESENTQVIKRNKLLTVQYCVRYFLDGDSKNLDVGIDELSQQYGKQEALQRLSIASLENMEFEGGISQRIKFLEFLIKMHGLNVNFTSTYLYSPNSDTAKKRSLLHIATAVFSRDLVEFLIEQGAQKNIIDSNGLNPFIQLISCPRSEVLSNMPLSEDDMRWHSELYTPLENLLNHD